MKAKILFLTLSLGLSHEALALSQQLVVRGRAGVFDSSASAPVKIGTIGILAEGAIEYLFNKNLGFEVAAGYGRVKIGSTGGKSKASGYIPLTATTKFTLPIYEQYYPYIGLGYTYGMISSVPKALKISNKGGIIVKIGADIYFEKTNTTSQPLAMNIDITQNLGAKRKNSGGGQCSIAKTTALIGVTVPI